MSDQSGLRHRHPPQTVYETVGETTVPWHFGSFAEEYDALRNHAVLFDHCGCGLIAVTGDALPFLNEVLARDVEFLDAERCMPSLLLDEDGVAVDLVVVYGSDDGVLIETSVGRRSSTLARLQTLAPDDVDVTDLSDEWAIIGIEGPYAWSTTSRIVDEELTALPFETVAAAVWEDRPFRFARTGFTGEYGYKILADRDTATALWDELATDARPAGQAVLESAMLEVRQPILHREFDAGATVLSCGFNWLVDLNKGPFVGRDEVERQWRDGVSHVNVGFTTAPDVPCVGWTVNAAELAIGRVVHAAASPGLDGTVGVASVHREFAVPGLSVELRDPDGGTHPARTVSSPYLVPLSWTVPIF